MAAAAVIDLTSFVDDVNINDINGASIVDLTTDVDEPSLVNRQQDVLALDYRHHHHADLIHQQDVLALELPMASPVALAFSAAAAPPPIGPPILELSTWICDNCHSVKDAAAAHFRVGGVVAAGEGPRRKLSRLPRHRLLESAFLRPRRHHQQRRCSSTYVPPATLCAQCISQCCGRCSRSRINCLLYKCPGAPYMFCRSCLEELADVCDDILVCDTHHTWGHISTACCPCYEYLNEDL